MAISMKQLKEQIEKEIEYFENERDEHLHRSGNLNLFDMGKLEGLKTALILLLEGMSTNTYNDNRQG